jgi:hypothetical protein
MRIFPRYSTERPTTRSIRHRGRQSPGNARMTGRSEVSWSRTSLTGLPASFLSLDDDLADLDDRRQVGVVLDVAQYLVRVRPEARLKRFD